MSIMVQLQLSREREELNRYLRKGKSSARSLTRARILLLADEGQDDEEIVKSLKVSESTVSRIRKRYCEGGSDFALHEKARSGPNSHVGIETERDPSFKQVDNLSD
jgi:hypothetical protein